MGLVCAPWLSPTRASDALARCPVAHSRAPAPVQVPDTPARVVSGWYRRTNLHAPAPAGVRELVQIAGEGFGPHDHPTTALCLRAIDRLPFGSAVDVGCGSGLLTQAWVVSGRGPCLGIDADPAAVTQARGSLAASSAPPRWQVASGRIESLDPHQLADVTVLANLPPIAHAALMRRLRIPPQTIILSGTTRADASAPIAHYRALGMRVSAIAVAGRYVCATLVRG